MEAVDLILRGIDAAIVKVIDDRAKKLKESRNAYLIRLVEQDAIKIFAKQERAYANQELKRVNDVMELVLNRLTLLEENHLTMITLLSIFAGVDLASLENIKQSNVTGDNNDETSKIF